jgi:hypothetical protein
LRRAISFGRGVLKDQADAIAAEFAQLSIAYSLLPDDVVASVFPSSTRHPTPAKNGLQIVTVLDTTSVARVVAITRRVRDSLVSLLRARNVTLTESASLPELAETLRQSIVKKYA